MNRLLSIFAAVLAAWTLASAGPARAETDAELLQRVEDYLNAMTTFDARFIQVNYDGSMAEGEFQLKRPMLACIAYDDPATVMVVRGQKIQIWDAEVGQFSEGPVSSSPASILLQSKFDLSEFTDEGDLHRYGDLVYLTIDPSDESRAGALTLVFDDSVEDADKPLELVQWLVRDAQGYTTRVNLDNAAFGVDLSNDLFEIDHKAIVRPGTSSN